MFDPARRSDELELEQEDCVCKQLRPDAGTAFAIPCSVGKLIRYFEVEIEVNRGGVFIGATSFPAAVTNQRLKLALY